MREALKPDTLCIKLTIRGKEEITRNFRKKVKLKSGNKRTNITYKILSFMLTNTF